MQQQEEKRKSKASEAEVLEVVAYSMSEIDAEMDSTRNTHPDAHLEAWQAEADRRTEFRAQAKGLIRRLSMRGVTARAADSKKVSKQLEYFRTVAPKVAYDLHGDTPPPSAEPDNTTEDSPDALLS